jgi:hypothetical protein
MIATQPIQAKSVVVSVPLTSTFSVRDADKPVRYYTTVSCVRHGCSSCWVVQINDFVRLLRMAKVDVSEDDILSLMLIRERYVKQEASKWHLHIAQLPEVVDSPFFFTAEEVEAFKGTNFHTIADALRRQTDQLYKDIHKVLEDHSSVVGIPVHIFSKKSYQWGLGMVWSRFVSLKISKDHQLAKVMVPYFDMFNHSPDALVTHAFDAKSQTVQIVTNQPWNAGDQVNLNYGNMPNLQMLLRHGFVRAVPRDMEHFTLELSIPRTAPALEKKTEMLQRYCGFCEMPPAVVLSEIRKSSTHAAGSSADVAETSAAAASEAMLSRWKRFVGNFGVLPESRGGGILVSVELFEGVPHDGLLRCLRILHCPEDRLADLEAIMRRTKDEGLDIALEAEVLQHLRNALIEQAKPLGAHKESEQALVKELFAEQETGEVAVHAITTAIQEALAAKGCPVVAEVEEEAGDDEEDELETPSILVSAAGSKKPRAKGKDRKRAPKSKESKAAMRGLLPTTNCAADTVAAIIPATRSQLHELAHRHRLQCAAYLRTSDRAILESHISITGDDIESLKVIAEHHNMQNKALVGDE